MMPCITSQLGFFLFLRVCCRMSVPFILSFLFREGNNITDQMSITYQELLTQVCKFANVLKTKGWFAVLIDIHECLFVWNLKLKTKSICLTFGNTSSRHQVVC